MNNAFFGKPTRIAWAVMLLGIGAATGHWWTQQFAEPVKENAVSVAQKKPQRRVLYWYDPMMPQQHFDKPGKSPFMDMELVPRYADENAAPQNHEQNAEATSAVRIDSAVAQNLGIRTAAVARSALPVHIDAVGNLRFDTRDIAVVQLRAGAFVEKVWPHAAGDIVQKGAPLVELLVPDWAVLQREYVNLKNRGNTALLKAARERLQIAGMPEDAIVQLERSGEVQTRVRMTAPIGGVITDWDVRSGMVFDRGAMLVRINGLATLWLDVAVPEAQAAQIPLGVSAVAELTALPGANLQGRIAQRLPSLDDNTRTARFRIEISNDNNTLLAGMTARAHIDVASAEQLHVPRDAVIRTGTRAVVMLAEGEGRFRPVEVTTGDDIGDRTVITAGLAVGDNVVVSGQFLVDSEASLSGVMAESSDRRVMQGVTP